MIGRQLRVTAPSRLHCGLLSICGRERRFGGAGLMVDRPVVQMSLSASDQFDVSGPSSERAREFAERWTQFMKIDSSPCRLVVESIPPSHVGLGSGTQLALAVSTALTLWNGLPSLAPSELAKSVGRGIRSAIGTYGFCGGGFVVDRGKSELDELSALDCRIDIPDRWRFVLMRPADEVGLSGIEERQVFERGRLDESQSTERLRDELRVRMLPAVTQGNFAAFSESLFEYGRCSGMLFAREQGGPYNGPLLTSIVETVRRLGVTGVAQSSWGPTLFAALENHETATDFVNRLRLAVSEELDIEIAAPNNSGAIVEIIP